MSQKAVTELFALKDDVYTKDEAYGLFLTQSRAASLLQALEDAVADEYLTKADAAVIYRKVSDSYSKGDTDSLLQAIKDQVSVNKARISTNAGNISSNLTSIYSIKTDVTTIYGRLQTVEDALDLYLKITDAADTYLTKALAESTYQKKDTAVTHTAGTAVGSSTNPIYINSSGQAVAGAISFAKDTKLSNLSTTTKVAVWDGGILKYVNISDLSNVSVNIPVCSYTLSGTKIIATSGKSLSTVTGRVILLKGYPSNAKTLCLDSGTTYNFKWSLNASNYTGSGSSILVIFNGSEWVAINNYIYQEHVCQNCSNCPNCNNCSNCSNCSNCYDCANCSDYYCGDGCFVEGTKVIVVENKYFYEKNIGTVLPGEFVLGVKLKLVIIRILTKNILSMIYLIIFI